VDQNPRIDRESGAASGPEADSPGRGHGIFVQAVAEPADQPFNLNFSGGSEQGLDQHFSFNREAASLLGVRGARLVENLGGYSIGGGFGSVGRACVGRSG
jgi:hypothetical protein